MDSTVCNNSKCCLLVTSFFFFLFRLGNLLFKYTLNLASLNYYLLNKFDIKIISIQKATWLRKCLQRESFMKVHVKILKSFKTSHTIFIFYERMDIWMKSIVWCMLHSSTSMLGPRRIWIGEGDQGGTAAALPWHGTHCVAAAAAVNRSTVLWADTINDLHSYAMYQSAPRYALDLRLLHSVPPESDCFENGESISRR